MKARVGGGVLQRVQGEGGAPRGAGERYWEEAAAQNLFGGHESRAAQERDQGEGEEARVARRGIGGEVACEHEAESARYKRGLRRGGCNPAVNRMRG